MSESLSLADIAGNLLTATPILFVNPAAADLHLLPSANAALDKAPALPVAGNDFDGNARPQAAGYDIGADEWTLGPIKRPSDFDGDRKDDILLRYPSAGDIHLWLLK